MRKRFSIICVAAAAGAIVAGCGSSGSSTHAATAAGVVQAPSAGQTGTAAATTPNVKLPTAFSTEPTITSPGGTPPTKLVTKDLITGTGPALTSPSQPATLAYVGALYSNGKVFDSSWKDEPSTHTITQAPSGFVPGFQQGLLGMKVGGRRELIIPPKLAYGANPPKSSGIPKNATLIFIVDLHSVSG